MRCHYEVLEVERDSDFDQIKLAYRKLALKWHPDKNPNNQEEAAERFKEVQAAYTVLSDAQERAWYDNHRESILRGVDDAEGEELHNINLWGYFSTSCYNGYDINTENNFYTVYGNLFAELDRHEEMEEFTDEYHEKRPLFGGPDATYNDLLNFYSTWEAFCSRKSFSWKDKYRLTDAPMRKIKRLMEKENKKLRNAARKKYNEEVRALARFVKKRDVRWEACVKEYKEKELEKQTEILNKKKIENEKKKEKLQEIQKAYEQELDSFDLEEIGISTADPDENDEKEEFYCFACKRAFRSNNQWLNHEKSKKHLEMVDVLRSSVMLEDEVFDPTKNEKEDEEDEEENGEIAENANEKEEEDGEKDAEEVEETAEKVEKVQIEEEEDEENDVRPNPAGMVSKRNKKKKKKQQQRNVRRFVEEEIPEPPKQEEVEVETQETEAAQETQEENQTGEEAPAEEETAAPSAKKKKARRAKKNPKNQAAVQQPSPVPEKAKNFDDELTCVTCGVSFASRNKLFAHVKEKKHAQPLSASSGGRRK